MKSETTQVRKNIKIARERWGALPRTALLALTQLTREYQVSLILGDLLYLDQHWYVSHAGCLRIAQRQKCCGINVECIDEVSEPLKARWTFKATVFKNPYCKGFVGYGDADPSNIPPQMRGAEMRIAETRAVNRALRKAYGIGICSAEEVGASAEQAQSCTTKSPPQSTNGSSSGPKVRDRLCQLIRQNELDPSLVKAYAIDFCRTKTLREANREQVENFVSHLAEWAAKDRKAVVSHLSSYLPASAV